MHTEKAAVQAFYDRTGWRFDEGAGAFTDGAVFDDLRPLTTEYRRRANERVRAALPAAGDRILDAASGAIQYEDYVRFSEGYRKRVCVDLSLLGLRAARRRIGGHGQFVRADVTALPFAADVFDAVVSLHTIYHVPEEEQATFLEEMARVLRPGRRAVVVSTWTTSPWDAALRIPRALVGRARRALARFGRPRPVDPVTRTAAPPEETASLYFHPTRRGWLRRAVPPALSLRIRCWRSVGVPFLRKLEDGAGSRRLLRWLARVEDRGPAWTGRFGVYPLLVFDKSSATPPGALRGESGDPLPPFTPTTRASYNAAGMGAESRDLDRVGDLWGRVAEARVEAPVRGWTDSPIVTETVLEPRLTPGRQGHWLVGLVDEVPIARGGRWASLGCGAAGTEIFAAGQGLFDSLLALDASPKALAEARKAAAAAGVTNLEFGEADLNRLELPGEAFDVVLMIMSLHHVQNLEGTLDVVKGALRPGGFLLVNEFVGPAQFQFPDVQVAIANEVLGILPDRWRMDVTTGQPKTQYVRQPRAYWNVADPSEAVRSDEIVTELERRFEVVLSRDYGGTILHLALEHIVHNFDRSDAKDVAAIRLLALLEDLLIRNGVLESDFTLRVLRKGPRTGPATPKRALLPGVEIEALRAKTAVLEADNARLREQIQRLEASRVWRLAQALRGLVGRRW